MKTYYCVTTSVYDDGHITAAITGTKQSEKKPQSHSKETSKCDIYTDWFESEADANAFIREAQNA